VPKSAILVDAGYALAQGGLVVCGTKRRADFDCAHEQLIAALNKLAGDHCDLERLRLYWYDGARDRLPTPDHLRIGNLPYVKVRLGRMGQDGRQKGVDALIYRDLMTLAREKAISRAYLVSGDEDLREGVVAAQDLGVQVVAIGFAKAGTASTSQSRDLVREADEHIILDSDFLAKFFSIPEADTEAEVRRATGVTQSDVLANGEVLGAQWATQATASEIQAILEQASLPRQIDAQLLKESSRQLGVNRIPDEHVRHLRNGFRKSVEAALSKEPEADAVPGSELE
jgi:uncharacterized LabA/DUF88 family protein